MQALPAEELPAVITTLAATLQKSGSHVNPIVEALALGAGREVPKIQFITIVADGQRVGLQCWLSMS